MNSFEVIQLFSLGGTLGLHRIKVAYYSFRRKTIDFFNLEHFQQLNVFTEPLITAIDVNYHFIF